MKFYIASYVGEKEQTQTAQRYLRSFGHEITVDWTALPGVPGPERNDREDDTAEIAVRDLNGVFEADVFVLIAGVPEGRAKYVELGAALASSARTGKPRVYVLGQSPTHSVFFFHPSVKRVATIDDVLADIGDR